MDNQERIKVTFTPDKNSSYTYWLPDVVNISEKTISKDMAEHSSKYLWFAALTSRLAAKRDHLSGLVKSLTAQTELQYREQAEKSGKKATENSIKAQLESDAELMSMRKVLSDAEAELQMCATIKDAFYHRQSMLVALGAMLRQEMHSLQADSLKG
jgi:hypothetical protein